jgi:hypothetical protein
MRTTILAILLVATAIGVGAAGPESEYKAPRTGNGQPDLQGVWNFSSDVPIQRPAAVADQKFFTREGLEKQKGMKDNALAAAAKLFPVEAIGVAWLDHAAQIENPRTSLITYPDNGRLPELVEGVRRLPGVEDIFAFLNNPTGPPPPALLALLAGSTKNGHEDFSPSERCLVDGSDGPPFTPSLDYNYLQIIQSKDYVVVRSEYLHHARIVPLDGRPHIGGTLRSWHGDSRGRWDGDTLVVETTNFNNRTQSFAGAGNSREKVVTERFTRVAPHALEYEATIVDAKTFQDKIVIGYPMAKVDAVVYESACHEGNYSMKNMLSAARKGEEEATNAAR